MVARFLAVVIEIKNRQKKTSTPLNYGMSDSGYTAHWIHKTVQIWKQSQFRLHSLPIVRLMMGEIAASFF